MCREVTPDGGRNAYCPAMAERRAERKRCRPRPRRLEAAGYVLDRVMSELKLGPVPGGDLGRSRDREDRRAGVCRDHLCRDLRPRARGETDSVPAHRAVPRAPPPDRRFAPVLPRNEFISLDSVACP